jgi:hypothetical protein
MWAVVVLVLLLKETLTAGGLPVAVVGVDRRTAARPFAVKARPC